MNLLDKLNPMQKEAVLHVEGPLLILAGAGSGKTRVLTHRIAYLLEQGVDPFHILAITFTNKAAREMRERVESLSDKGNQVWVSTFHSSCVRILRREINRLGYGNNFTIYDADDSERVLKTCIRELDLNDKLFPVKAVAKAISDNKNILITPESFEKTAGDFRGKQIAKIYTEYQRRLKNNNSMDFDDLLFKTVELLTYFPDVLEKYQDRFKYIMVDEYQDTNTAQYEFIRLLSLKYKNLCVVGDDDQSIYGWRGADIRNILEFEKDFKDTFVIKLEQNYRSTKTILDTANAVIDNNTQRKKKTLWSENATGNKIKFLKAQSDYEEGAFICEVVKKAKEAGQNYSDFAILYRNNALSRIIEDQLVKANIPYRLFGGVRFYERKEIKDVLAFLRAVYNPFDEVSLLRTINIPKRGIGDATIEKVRVYAKKNDIPFFSALNSLADIENLGTKAKNLKEFRDYILGLQEYSQNATVTEILEKIMMDTKYTKELEAEGTDEAKGRIENINELFSKAAEFEKQAELPSLSLFLEEVALVAAIDNYAEGEDTVVLMTLHSSKGLEFPNVFLTGFEEGIFPSYMTVTSGTQKELEEERRLLYVGITRAKEQLYITAALSRMQRGQTMYNGPSRFLKEIPNIYLEDLKAIPIKPKKEVQKAAATSTTRTGISQFAEINKTRNSIDISFGGKNYNTNTISAPKNISIDFSVGDQVMQQKYGVGVVKEIKSAGADYEVTVEFPEKSVKKFMAHLSKLKKVE